MKFILVSVLTLLASGAFAQGPMPPCSSQAQYAALSAAQSEWPNHQLDDRGIALAMARYSTLATFSQKVINWTHIA